MILELHLLAGRAVNRACEYAATLIEKNWAHVRRSRGFWQADADCDICMFGHAVPVLTLEQHKAGPWL